jgi:hypothetical protein
MKMEETKLKKIISSILVVLLVVSMFALTGCDLGNETSEGGSKQDVTNTKIAANTLQANQPTPSRINYSLARYNLIRRAYWVNGQREKANALVCQIEKPLGYIVLFSGNVVVGSFVVDGKVSSLNSFLTPDSEYYEQEYGCEGWSNGNKWLADVDGSYGQNDSGIFFFTPDGKYIEWSGDYLYSDIPFVVESPVLNVDGGH